MISKIALFFTGYASLAAASVEFTKHKIFMAGSQEPFEAQFFRSVAERIATNPDTRNEIYLLVHDIKETEQFKIKTDTGMPRLHTIQAPRLSKEEEPNEKTRTMNRRMKFAYDPSKTEEENYVDLDLKHVQLYFSKNSNGQLEFIEFLKAQNFDVGMGSLYMADSLLMRALDLNFLKLTPEDIESWTMQFKLGMPVQLSSYPSSPSFSNWEYDDLPDQDSSVYRF
jgi:hypothetical protein